MSKNLLKTQECSLLYKLRLMLLYPTLLSSIIFICGVYITNMVLNRHSTLMFVVTASPETIISIIVWMAVYCYSFWIAMVLFVRGHNQSENKKCITKIEIPKFIHGILMILTIVFSMNLIVLISH